MILFVFSRLFNAASLLLASVLAALIVGADNWSVVAIMHTTFSYLVLVNLGVNEGLGQRVVKKVKFYNSTFEFFQSILVIISISFLLSYFFLLAYRIETLLLISGTSSILLFSLMRIYYRGVRDLKALSALYVSNAIIILTSPLFVYLFDDSLVYIYSFILASVISSGVAEYFSIREKRRSFFQKLNFKYTFLINRIGLLIKVGFPIMLAGLVFELIISVDRFYIKHFYSEQLVGNIGLSLMLVKGVIMILSILNTVHFKTLSEQVSLKNNSKVIKLYHHQVFVGLSISLLFNVCLYLMISNNNFVQFFPSYSDLSSVFVFQSLIVIPLSFLFPLSVISNFHFGGKAYLFFLILILVIYAIFSVCYHFFVGPMSIKNLSIFVFMSFSLGTIALYKGIFHKGALR